MGKCIKVGFESKAQEMGNALLSPLRETAGDLTIAGRNVFSLLTAVPWYVFWGKEIRH